MNLKERIEEMFVKYRFDKETHIGLGDIRLTIGEQEKFITDILKAIRKCLPEKKDEKTIEDVKDDETFNAIRFAYNQAIEDMKERLR